MKASYLPRALETAVLAARQTGQLLRKNWGRPPRVNTAHLHDLKIELDVRSQRLIEKALLARFPQIPILGEEGEVGDATFPWRWVVDPIDGTVNFAHGIPHVSISIALQKQAESTQSWETMAGVVFDPFCDELWTALRGKPAHRNGRRIRVSSRARLEESIVSVGFGKSIDGMKWMIPKLAWVFPRARKVRLMGSAALGLAYVATGRFDAYVESGLSLWDVAAGGLIVECAGGEFLSQPLAEPHALQILASNGVMRRKLGLFRFKRAEVSSRGA